MPTILEKAELELLSAQLGDTVGEVEQVTRSLRDMMDDPREPVIDDATAGRLLMLARYVENDAETLRHLANQIADSADALWTPTLRLDRDRAPQLADVYAARARQLREEAGPGRNSRGGTDAR